MTPEQRRQRAKIAANARWSRYMAREDQAAVMKDVMRARLEREVDPEGKLSPAQRAALVRAAGRRLAAKLNAAKARKQAVQNLPDSGNAPINGQVGRPDESPYPIQRRSATGQLSQTLLGIGEHFSLERC